MIDPIKIVACMIWYDEATEDLQRAILSLRGFADSVIVVDGAFQKFPRGKHTPWSEAEQLQTIIANAKNGDDDFLEILAYQPRDPGEWVSEEGNEVEKRNAAFRMAGWIGATWVLNCDADMFLMHGDRTEIENLLRDTEHDVAVVDIEGKGQRGFFRWSEELHYYKTHSIVIAGEKVLAGLPDQVSALDLTTKLLFDHPEKTEFWRKTRQKSWHEIRDKGVEAL